MKRSAPAKINLGLRLLHRRSDGFHELETFLHTLEWGDDLELEAAGDIGLHVVVAPDAPHPEFTTNIPRDDRNLAWKAAGAVLREIEAPGVHIRLTKRIPPGAGLGGGSSDAAAVIAAVPALYGVDLPRDRVLELAASLGADVPFFIDGGCSLAEGIGQKLTAVKPLADTPVVLLFPPVMVSTPEAYEAANYGLTRSGTYRDYLHSVEGDLHSGALDGLTNDLEQAVTSANPEIAEHLSALEQTGPFYFSMTGSGSAVYGLYDDRNVAERACRRLTAEGAKAVLTRLA